MMGTIRFSSIIRHCHHLLGNGDLSPDQRGLLPAVAVAPVVCIKHFGGGLPHLEVGGMLEFVLPDDNRRK